MVSKHMQAIHCSAVVSGRASRLANGTFRISSNVHDRKGG